jgi:hypothetical protein
MTNERRRSAMPENLPPIEEVVRVSCEKYLTRMDQPPAPLAVVRMTGMTSDS